MGDSENNMYNTRTTSSLARANRRARVLSSRGRVSPRRKMLSNVVDVDSIINDALGTTVGSWEGRASSRPESGLKYSAAALTAFGENVSVDSPTPTQNSNFFTGKPYVEGLGHAFCMRNYRAGLAKWQTADPMGYPDGWNALAYCNNGVTSSADLWGCHIVIIGRVTYNLGALFSDEDIDPDKAKDPDYEVYLGDVWLDCNHNYDNPQATLGIGQRNGVLYVTQYTKDGVKCKLSAQMTLSPDSKSPIVKIDQNTKAVDWKWAAKISMDVTATKKRSNGAEVESKAHIEWTTNLESGQHMIRRKAE